MDRTDHAQRAALARRVVSLARLAPSVHNTQPWQFYAEGDTVELWADRERALPVLDPDSRQLHHSCGAALLHARLAARGAGRECRVQLLPDPLHPDHLATLVLGGPAAPDPEEERLRAAVLRRHTARAPFDPAPLPDTVRTELTEAAAAEGVTLHCVADADRPALAVLLQHVDAAQAADPAYRRELRRWVRRDEGAADGVPALAAAEVDRAGRAVELALRDFGVELPAPRAGGEPPAGEPAGGEPAPPERPLLGVLVTEGDGPAEWLAAGQALARVLLAGAARGVAASPLGQLVDTGSARAALRRELRLVGHPQVVLRLGRGHGTGAPRREVEDLLVVSERG